MKTKKYTRWALEKDAEIETWYGILSDEDLAATLKCSTGAIRARAQLLGIKRNKSNR